MAVPFDIRKHDISSTLGSTIFFSYEKEDGNTFICRRKVTGYESYSKVADLERVTVRTWDGSRNLWRVLVGKRVDYCLHEFFDDCDAHINDGCRARKHYKSDRHRATDWVEEGNQGRQHLLPLLPEVKKARNTAAKRESRARQKNNCKKIEDDVYASDEDEGGDFAGPLPSAILARQIFDSEEKLQGNQLCQLLNSFRSDRKAFEIIATKAVIDFEPPEGRHRWLLLLLFRTIFSPLYQYVPISPLSPLLRYPWEGGHAIDTERMAEDLAVSLHFDKDKKERLEEVKEELDDMEYRWFTDILDSNAVLIRKMQRSWMAWNFLLHLDPLSDFPNDLGLTTRNTTALYESISQRAPPPLIPRITSSNDLQLTTKAEALLASQPQRNGAVRRRNVTLPKRRKPVNQPHSPKLLSKLRPKAHRIAAGHV
ncbi:hypothetical protein BT69DRAFT_156582 [Atractiella rhizophila]|nr:hypothetical protein BT69DRAFT_156582 [Atractiella rhizophila]